MKITKKKIIIIILTVIALIFAAFVFDYIRVTDGGSPIFSIKVSDDMYFGLGWAFEICPHPITGKNEYICYIFGNIISNNITN